MVLLFYFPECGAAAAALVGAALRRALGSARKALQ